MRALILTNEFPPQIYGGAGVHVGELTRHLRDVIDLDIRTFASTAAGDAGWRVRGYEPPHDLSVSKLRRPHDTSIAAGPVRAFEGHL